MSRPSGKLDWPAWLGSATLLPAVTALGWSVYRTAREFVPLKLLLGPQLWGLGLLLVGAALALGLALRAEFRAEFRAASRPELETSGRRGWLPLRAAFVTIVLTAVTYLALLPGFDMIWLELLIGPAAGLFALALLAARGGGRRARALDFVCFQLCLAVCAVEVGLRATSQWTGNPLLAQEDAGPWRYLNRRMLPPGTLWWGYPTNSEGHYDDEFGPRAEGQRLVASVGDSFSVGTVHHSQHFTTVAERSAPGGDLRIDNYGAPGIGLEEYRDMLRLWVLPRAPDLVVLNLFVGNDLLVRRDTEQRSWPSFRRWLDRGNALSIQVPRRLMRLGDSGATRTFRMQPKRPLETAEQILAEMPWTADPSLEAPTFSEAGYLALEAERARYLCLLGDFEQATQLLRAILEDAGELPLAVVLIPDEFQVEQPLWEAVVEHSPGLAGADRDRAQRTLIPLFERWDLPYLDLLPVLRAVPPGEDGRRHLYHLRDTHFNRRGNEVAGRALGAFVAELLER